MEGECVEALPMTSICRCGSSKASVSMHLTGLQSATWGQSLFLCAIAVELQLVSILECIIEWEQDYKLSNYYLSYTFIHQLHVIYVCVIGVQLHDCLYMYMYIHVYLHYIHGLACIQWYGGGAVVCYSFGGTCGTPGYVPCDVNTVHSVFLQLACL